MCVKTKKMGSIVYSKEFRNQLYRNSHWNMKQRWYLKAPLICSVQKAKCRRIWSNWLKKRKHMKVKTYSNSMNSEVYYWQTAMKKWFCMKMKLLKLMGKPKELKNSKISCQDQRPEDTDLKLWLFEDRRVANLLKT